ncbi:MAG: YARHG domain-containing protein [Bacteroidetes bacterium]|nr:YARHG domain-containing protein [Bacteroidota bacterium]
MKLRSALVILINLVCFKVNANDGVYYSSGNHLIPITESDISIKKEVLKLTKLGDKHIGVSVQYEFFNPGEDKEVIVGFEAFSPSGDVNAAPKYGQHPFISGFTVTLNNDDLLWECAIVSDTGQYVHGKISGINLDTFKGVKEGNYVDFYYVYHFKANFKKGINHIEHTYYYNLSGSVDYRYNFEYILTAANRWANHQIDDFHLIIDPGIGEELNIMNSFFDFASDWHLSGHGKAISSVFSYDTSKKTTVFYVQSGTVEFRTLNFKPKGELFVFDWNYYGFHANEADSFDHFTSELPFAIEKQDYILPPKTKYDRDILNNLPFARRGYVFHKNWIQDYFENHVEWYVPDPNYKIDLSALTSKEIEWVLKW